MKSNAEAVIIGGGIIGVSLAYFLSTRMDGVVLLERKGVGAEASSANYGMVWQQARQPGYDLAIARRSLELYPVLIKDVFDLDIEYEYRGGLTIFLTEIQKEAAKEYVRFKQGLGIPVQLLDGAETRELEPALSGEVAGSIFCAGEAQLNPIHATRAFARAAEKAGARIYTETEATGIKVERGAVAGVITGRGAIKTKTVINAAGSWSARVGRMAGVEVPVYPHRLQSMVTEQLPRLLTRTIQGARVARSAEEAAKTFQYAYDATGAQAGIYREPPPEQWLESSLLYLKPAMSGNIVLGTACDFAGFDRGTNREALALIAAMARRVVPRLNDVNIIRSWSNFDPWTADGVPIVEETGVKGFIVCAGHGTGLSHGPATGEAVAAWLTTGTPTIELPRKRLNPPAKL